MTQVRSWMVPAAALLLTATLVTTSQAQRSRRGMRGSFLQLVSAEKVQKELKLNEEQIAKAKAAGEKLREDVGKEFAGVRDIEDRQKRREKFTLLAEKFDEKARGQLREVLSDEQMIRLYQIRLQVRGDVFGVNHAWIANRLKLSDEQKKKAAQLEADTREKTYASFSGLRDLSEQQRREKFEGIIQKVRKIRSDADAQAVELLSDEQKKSYQECKGEKFEL